MIPPEIPDFLFELDLLKLVNRRSYINGGERLENSAEHSWHLAMACWTLSQYFNKPLNLEKLLKLALIHDLGEIDAGDTFLYAATRDTANQAEREGVLRLAEHPGNHIDDLLPLWDEQEYGDSPETKFLKVVDRLLPFLHNLKSEGKAWQENNIAKNQVLAAHVFIEHSEPEIHQWLVAQLDLAVAKGWLKE